MDEKKKVDKGFELNYWKLSYRRKFIRTIWTTPFAIIVCVAAFYLKAGYYDTETSVLSKYVEIDPILLSIIMGIVYVWQLVYNYNKWKKEEKEKK